MKTSIILNVDSYKTSMWTQYPTGTTGVYSYIESRGGRYDSTVFFGLQAFIKEYLLGRINADDIDTAEAILTAHGEPFNREGWEYILNKHDGLLPIVIRAVPEGTVVPVQNALLTIENTDPECFWLTTWLETALLRAVWYPTTVATQSYTIKKLILQYLEKTGDPQEINFKLHDFGARGVSSLESAGLGSLAHLINFYGSDTIAGIIAGRNYYSSDICGFSIPAAEHSTITSWGRENEVEAYRNMLTNFARPGSVVAVVSDSYDIFNACEKLWGTELKQTIIDSGATLVIRPDSGDPATVVLKCLQILAEKFGVTINNKGYKVINNVRVLQGDGINYESIQEILETITNDNFSADNVAFGMGSGLLQQLNRDTCKFAMKASCCIIDGKEVDIFKDPITDPGKRSKAGRISLWTSGGEFQSSVSQPKNWTDKGTEWTEVLEEVFRDGKLVKEITFDQVRLNSQK